MQELEKFGIIFNREDSSSIKVDHIPFITMQKYRQLKDDNTEAGGILLGRMIDGSNDVIIDEITVPLKRDKRSRFSFFRSSAVQKIINAVWKKSHQTRNYLGEWHTHPERDPTPSQEDLDNWKRVISNSIFQQDYLIFIIVGQVTMKAWELRKGISTPRQLYSKG
jgi:integrative and conjugative element protein (TIGR02256 family)